ATYGPLLFFAVSSAVIILTCWLVRLVYHRRIRRSAAWDCGFARQNTRMQDTAEGFGQPIRHVFQPFLLLEGELPSPFDATPRYRLVLFDRIWRSGYVPLGRLVRSVANIAALLQQGRIATYLTYSFATLIVLLALVL